MRRFEYPQRQIYGALCASRKDKMKILRVIITTFFLLGQSCTQIDNQFEQLLKSPDKFQGQEIEITGIIHERFEDNAIYLTKNSSTDKAVWIEYSKLFMRLNTFQGLDGQKIKVKGQFDQDDKGHLGQYAGTLRETVIVME